MDWKLIDELPSGLKTVFLTGRKAELIDPVFYLDDGSPVYLRLLQSDLMEAYKQVGITHFARMPAPPQS